MAKTSTAQSSVATAASDEEEEFFDFQSQIQQPGLPDAQLCLSNGRDLFCALSQQPHLKFIFV
jgi:hypothetical protein